MSNKKDNSIPQEKKPFPLLEWLEILHQNVSSLVENSYEKRPPSRADPKIIHYFTEILRYWSKIHYIDRKIRRSLSKYFKVKKFPFGLTYFLIYRYFWEGATYRALIDDMNQEVIINRESWKTSKSLWRKFIRKFYSRMHKFDWEIALKGKQYKERLSIKYAIPSFFLDRVLPHIKKSEITPLLKHINSHYEPQFFTIRINPLAENFPPFSSLKRNVLSYLDDCSIPFFGDTDFDPLLHIPIKYKSNIILSPLYKNGKVLIHDKSSYIAAKILEPRPNEIILDSCTAPGIKSSIISQLSNLQSRIIAMDFHQRRLSEASHLLGNLGVYNCHLIGSDAVNPPLRRKNIGDLSKGAFNRDYLGDKEDGFEAGSTGTEFKADKVFVDAPCTGSGVLSSNPELKWRQNHRFFHQNLNFQRKILEESVKYLKKDGILVYCNCSLYYEEGEKQIQNLLEKFPLKMEKIDYQLHPPYEIQKIEQKIGLGRTFEQIPQPQMADQNTQNTQRKIDVINSSFFYAKLRLVKNI